MKRVAITFEPCVYSSQRLGCILNKSLFTDSRPACVGSDDIATLSMPYPKLIRFHRSG